MRPEGRLLFQCNRAGHFELFPVGVNKQDERRITSDTKDTAEVVCYVRRTRR